MTMHNIIYKKTRHTLCVIPEIPSSQSSCTDGWIVSTKIMSLNVATDLRTSPLITPPEEHVLVHCL